MPRLAASDIAGVDGYYIAEERYLDVLILYSELAILVGLAINYV